jgi:hypothetical protein
MNSRKTKYHHWTRCSFTVTSKRVVELVGVEQSDTGNWFHYNPDGKQVAMDARLQRGRLYVAQLSGGPTTEQAMHWRKESNISLLVCHSPGWRAERNRRLELKPCQSSRTSKRIPDQDYSSDGPNATTSLQIATGAWFSECFDFALLSSALRKATEK